MPITAAERLESYICGAVHQVNNAFPASNSGPEFKVSCNDFPQPRNEAAQGAEVN